MAREDMNKRFAILGALWVFFVFYAIFLTGGSALAAPLPDWARARNATSILQEIVEYTSAEQVAKLIQDGADVNALDIYKLTPLILAARRNPNPEVLRILIESGADVAASNPYGRKALFYAEFNNKLKGTDAYKLLREKTIESVTGATELLHAIAESAIAEEVTELIRDGADVNAVRNGRTSLMLIAARNPDPEAVRVLIENGAKVNAADEYGDTPLTMAAKWNLNPDIIRVLIENGADVTARDKNGSLAFDLAEFEERDKKVKSAKYHFLREKTAESIKDATEALLLLAQSASAEKVAGLIGEGADVNAAEKRYGWSNKITPLMWAASENPNPEVLRVLIQNGADTKAIGKYDMTILMLAAEKNSNPEVLRTLIEIGADVNAATGSGWTSLIWAARSNANPEILQVLIENGANVNAVGDYGMTPLMYAAEENSNPEVLRTLIENGAEVNAVAVNGWTPLFWAAVGNTNSDIFRLLIEKGADVNAADDDTTTLLMRAAGRNTNPDILRILIENGADVSAADKDGQTPLIYAIENENPEVVRVLVENGVSANTLNRALREAAQSKSKTAAAVLRILIDNGADVNSVDRDGSTPLMYCAYRNMNYEALMTLMENGADVNAADKRGRTPLMYVADTGTISKKPLFMRALIQNGADVNAVDNAGQTPLMLTVQRHYNDGLEQILLGNGADAAIKDIIGKSAADYEKRTPSQLENKVMVLLFILYTVVSAAPVQTALVLLALVYIVYLLSRRKK